MKLITAMELDILHRTKGPLGRATSMAVLGALVAPVMRLDPCSWMEGLEVREGQNLIEGTAAGMRGKRIISVKKLCQTSLQFRRCADSCAPRGATTADADARNIDELAGGPPG